MQVEMIFALKNVCVQTQQMHSKGLAGMTKETFFIQVKTARISQERIQ